MKILLRIFLVFLFVALPMGAAVNRTISIESPAQATAGSTVSVAVHARTDARDGEQVGFLHAEYSIDEGKTWTKFVYAEKAGAEQSGKVNFAVHAHGGNAIVRVRAAFRGGIAGNIDYKGGAIQWSDSWQNWRWPPAKFAIIQVPKVPAVKRAISIQAPAEAEVGSIVSVTVHASTDARDGEQIGFLHAEYSMDEGKTWTQVCYAEKSGANMSQQATFVIGAKCRKALIRVRVAFRGGTAGDVDHQGGAIQWDDSWQNWRSPVAKYAIIYTSRS